MQRPLIDWMQMQMHIRFCTGSCACCGRCLYCRQQRDRNCPFQDWRSIPPTCYLCQGDSAQQSTSFNWSTFIQQHTSVSNTHTYRYKWTNSDRTYTVFHKKTPFCFFHNLLKWWSIYTKFVSVAAEKNTNSKYCNKIWQLIEYSLLVLT